MSLPPRAFYSLNETSARWGCAAADLAGWAATDHLTLVTSIASVICGKQPVAGIVVVSAADMMRMFRRHGPSDEECRIYRIAVRARAVDMLGRQQIAGIPTALHELFKNAHDAYPDHRLRDYLAAGSIHRRGGAEDRCDATGSG